MRGKGYELHAYDSRRCIDTISPLNIQHAREGHKRKKDERNFFCGSFYIEKIFHENIPREVLIFLFLTIKSIIITFFTVRFHSYPFCVSLFVKLMLPYFFCVLFSVLSLPGKISVESYFHTRHGMSFTFEKLFFSFTFFLLIESFFYYRSRGKENLKHKKRNRKNKIRKFLRCCKLARLFHLSFPFFFFLKIF